IWNNNRVLREIREGIPDRFEGICSDCLMRRVCLGYCLAYNYYINKNFWAPSWYCREARRKGLFPETRIAPGSTLKGRYEEGQEEGKENRIYRA
ncbi:MAG: hypothetical protein JSU92_01730, partial [Deltaproteobacteria bacterium]